MCKNSKTKPTFDAYSHLKSICNLKSSDEADTNKSYRVYISSQNMRNIKILCAAQSLKSHNDVISMLLAYYFERQTIEVK